MAGSGDTSPEAGSTGTRRVGAGKGSVEAEADTYTPAGAGSRCSQGAVGRRNVEVAAAYSTLEAEAGKRI